MPATVTHAYFANDLYDSLPIGLKKLLMDDKKRLRMFAQSTDSFIFYNLLKKKDQKIRDFQSYFHTNKTREFFINLSACISQIVRKNNFITGSGTILELMNDNFIRKIILNYPYKNTNFKSKVFLELFVKKRAKILFILFKVSRA